LSFLNDKIVKNGQRYLGINNFESLKDIEDTLAEQLKNLDKEAVKSVCLYQLD